MNTAALDRGARRRAFPAGADGEPPAAEVQASRLLRVAKVGMAIKAAMQARSRRTGPRLTRTRKAGVFEHLRLHRGTSRWVG
jgi:hypothetical protein